MAMLRGRRANHQCGAGNGSPRRRTFALAFGITLVLAAASATAAQAEAESNAEFTCKAIYMTFTGFPNLPGNTVYEKVKIDGVKSAVTHKTVFNGPEGTDTIPLNLTPGFHKLDVFSKWNTNGVKGGRDQPANGGLTCPADPEFTIQKLQRFAGEAKYTTATLALGHVGKTVEYEVVVKNTGNVPLTFTNFLDPKCDEGTITGGPSEPVALGGSTTYFCKHVLTEADREVGFYTNAASVTGTPEGGPETTEESNTVVVELPTPKNEVEFTCKTFFDYLSGFPNVPGNEVRIKVKIDGVAVFDKVIVFNGPTYTFEYEVNLSPGHHKVDILTTWKTHTFKGSTDRTLAHGINCAAEPSFTIQKLQKLDGGEEAFTTSPITAQVGEQIDYEIIITNTGNTSLKFGPLEDPGCDEGTIAGGPGEEAVAPAGPSIPPGKTTFTCDHVVTLQDGLAGSYSNTATETGTPPEGQGSPVTNSSNTVEAEITEIA
jgi:hypothetical protein